MQIKELPSSSTLASNDVLVKETNGGTTQKITGADFVGQVKNIGNLLGADDVVNNLNSSSPTAPLAAAQGKALDNAKANASDIAIIIEGNQTTHTGGAAIGEFVLVRNSTITGITDGQYTAAQAIPANTAIDSTYLAAVDGGGLNAVNKKITYSLTNVVNKNPPNYELYKVGKIVILSIHSIWKASVAKDTWETWADVPSELLSDISTVNPFAYSPLIDGYNGNVVGSAIIEVQKSSNSIKVKSNVALSGSSGGYGIAFTLTWYNA